MLLGYQDSMRNKLRKEIMIKIGLVPTFLRKWTTYKTKLID
jgi:hypothetical protein